MKIKCTCQHKFQDQQHGKGIRVANPITGKSQGNGRCTVCSSEKSAYNG